MFHLVVQDPERVGDAPGEKAWKLPSQFPRILLVIAPDGLPRPRKESVFHPPRKACSRSRKRLRLAIHRRVTAPAEGEPLCLELCVV